MSRNFILSARKQGDSAQNLNLRCGPGTSKRSFGAYRDPDACRYRLLGARCDDLGAYRNELLRGGRCCDVGAGRHRLLRDAKCYDFVACIDRLFRDIGRCDLSISGYSLSQDAWRRGFIAPKYELCSRVNCDYSASVLLSGAVRYGFAARNSAKFSSDTYCGSSVSAYLRRVGTNQDTRSRRDSSANVRLRRSPNASDPLQRVSDRPARTACLHCRFGANPDSRLRCGFGADYFKNSGGISTRNFKISASNFTRNFKNLTRSLEAEPVQSFKISALNFIQNFWNSARGREAEPAQSFKDQNLAQDFSQNGKSYDQNSTQSFSQSGRSAEPNSKPSFSQNIKNSERNFPLSFLQGIKNSDQSQNSKHASAQSHAEPNSVQDFSQSSKNSDRNFKTNSMQNQAEPVSPQELKNSEPCPAQRQELGFYAPKFKDERARNFFSHPMRTFILCACFFAALGALSFLAPDALAIDYVSAHKFYFLFLAPSCIYAAFLLTALPDWTNFEGSLKPVSLAFAACLIAAFIASFLNLRLAAAIVALFWAIFFIFAARLLWLDKNSNNFSILAVLAAFCACSAAYGASGDEKFLLSFVHINAAAIAVVSYRISVVIGNEALKEGGLKDAVFIPNFIYKNLAAFLAFALALATPFLSEATCGFIALGIGFLFLAKLRELHYVEILSRHYMAFYYALQAACAAGYAWLGWELIRGGYAAAPLHVIAICYMYGAILFVGMIAGQRHSGISPLNFPRLSRAALVLALLAGVLRAVFAGESFILYVMIPSALFIAAVALYLINFIPIFLKNPFSADPD
ncbi:NnrS family protein [Campylobacter sp.]|uniref:NnrS family protein n=1 Tax=Campylobacter sp. TaxID=205 RepID=UPI0025C6934D|nr:NnrS family protein [Campylobacter sp.]